MGSPTIVLWEPQIPHSVSWTTEPLMMQLVALYWKY
jgi:hypothetical protein